MAPDPRAMRSRASGVDVARLANVSQKTVSRVMNGGANVRPEVAERVWEAARRLNYRPNTAARALNTGRTGRIGMVALASAHYGPASQLISAEASAGRAGYSLTVVSMSTGSQAELARAIDTLLEQGVDGIIVSEPLIGEPLDMHIDVPVVALGRADREVPGVSTVHVDTATAAYTATRHLLDLGHETVWHITGSPNWWASQEREEGWRRALQEAGAGVPAPIPGDWSASCGYRAALDVLAPQGATAVFAANDDTAIGVIRGLKDLGRAVPDDVSVVGVDDIPLAAYVDPPLTTARQAFDVVGDAALRRLVEALEYADRGLVDPDASPHPRAVDATSVVIAAELVVRSSSAPPRPGRTIRTRPTS